MRAAAVSSATRRAATSAAAASRAASCCSAPSSASSAVGDDALDVAVELQPAGADDRDLAAEPQLEDELGLEPAGELAEPGADDGDRRLVGGTLAQARGERVDRGGAVAEDDLLLGREVA